MCLEKLQAASVVALSLHSCLQCPFLFAFYNVSEAVFWEAKVTSQLHILGCVVSAYFRCAQAKIWNMHVVWTTLLLQGILFIFAR